MKPNDIAPNFDLTLVDGSTTSFYDLIKDKTTSVLTKDEVKTEKDEVKTEKDEAKTETPKHKTTILFFYPSSASYSKTCQKQAAAFNEALSELGDKVQVVGVSVGSLDELRNFKEKFASGFPVGLISRETQRNYDARKTGFLSVFLPDIAASKRVTFLIDPQHKILNRIDLPQMANGPQMTAHAREVVTAIKALQAQQPAIAVEPQKEWTKEIAAAKESEITGQTR